MIAILGILASSVAPVAMAEADPEKGERVYKKCRSCHEIGDDAQNGTGPHLNDIIGRPIGAVAEFDYSDEMAAAGAAGQIWDEEALKQFFERPKIMFPGTKMSFAGLKREKDRDNLIAYLASLSAGEMQAAASDPEVPAAILAIEGDPAYGEYLSSTCVTCHQLDGSDQGLPSITGWPAERFVTVMHAYKNKHRENPVMQQYAGALGDEEIAALAAYFESVK